MNTKFAKLTQYVALFGEWNPVKLTKTICNLLGEVKDVKILCNESSLIFYRDWAQQGKTILLNRRDGKRVQCSVPEDKEIIRGVIAGIQTVVSKSEIM